MLLITSWMQFWLVISVPNYLNLEGFISYIHMKILSCILVTQHKNMSSFSCIYFYTNRLTKV
jgi:hypothetical protein